MYCDFFASWLLFTEITEKVPLGEGLLRTHISSRSVKHIDIQQLYENTMEYVLCNGVTKILQYSGDIKHHVIPKSHDPLSAEDDEGESSASYHHDDYYRSTNCELLIPPSQIILNIHEVSVQSGTVKSRPFLDIWTTEVQT